MTSYGKYLLSFLAIVALGFGSATTAKAIPINIVGTSNSTQSTAILNCTLSGNVLTFSLQNTSPGGVNGSTITGIGFDLIPGDFTASGSSGLNGFSGSQTGGSGTFTFTDAALGNPNQFNNTVLDFGFTTGNSGNFNGGTVAQGIAPGQIAFFTVTGPFQGLSESQICNSIFVRFQNTPLVGSDVGRPGGSAPPPAVPEPTTMLLLGTGLTGIAAKLRRRNKKA